MSDFKIIDTHSHLGQEPTYPFVGYGVDNLLKLMDMLDIEKSVNANLFGMYDQFEKAAQMNEDIFRQSNGRLFFYHTFTPTHSKKAIEVIRANKDNKKYKGIKIHPSGVAIDADDDRWIPVWEIARELKLPIISHTWTKSTYHPSQNSAFAGKFERFVSAYPDVKFTFAHSGGRFEGVMEAARISKQHKNCYCDIAGDINGAGVLDYLYENIGPDRILYGSDVFMIEQRPMLGVVYGSSRLSLADKEKILRYNAEQLYFSD